MSNDDELLSIRCDVCGATVQAPRDRDAPPVADGQPFALLPDGWAYLAAHGYPRVACSVACAQQLTARRPRG